MLNRVYFTVALVMFASDLMALKPNATASAEPQTQTAQGTIEGIQKNGIDIYKGIPYAKPPVGKLRWRAPQAPSSWTGIKKASKFGFACPQHPRKLAGWMKQHYQEIGQSEDCLTLNIWTPKNNGKKRLPVMVYLHGGNFKFGSGSEPVYDGELLAKKGVIIVTLNYRIGFLGRFAHPALSRSQPNEGLANYGTMDQIRALQWIKQNIGAFGGDANNVTLFGHSAGGVSINYLMTTPATKNLFHKAIAQGSGVMIDRSRHISEPGITGALEQSAEQMGLSLTEHFNIHGNDQKITEQLRSIPIEELLRYQKSIMTTFNPVVDGVVIPDHIARIFERGEQHRIPYIGGANSWEWSQISTMPLIAKWFTASSMLAGYSDDDLTIYDNYWTRIGVSQQWFAEGLFLLSTRYLAKQMSNTSAPTYQYHLTYIQDQLKEEIPGAPHGVEVAFIFGNIKQHPEYQRPKNIALSSNDLAFGNLLQDYWVSFAKTGNPNGNERPDWPQYTTENDLTMKLDGLTPTAKSGIQSKHLNYLENLYLQRRYIFEN